MTFAKHACSFQNGIKQKGGFFIVREVCQDGVECYEILCYSIRNNQSDI